jgi:aminocarboxymuconate-semialdehyde decarboxylase
VVIDIHTHFHSKALEGKGGEIGPRFVSDDKGKTFWQIGARRQGAPKSIYDLDERVRKMDEAGVDVHILSNSPKWFLYNTIHKVSADTCIRFAQLQNDDLAGAKKKYPKRFESLATLPLVDVKASLKELDRAVNELGMKGVVMDSTVGGRGLDSEELYPIYERLQATGTPVFVHPGFLPDPRINQYGFRWMIGFCFDETYALGCLVFGGVMDRFPELRVVITHGGGAAPFLLGRLIEGPKHREPVKSKYPFDHYLKRFYYDACTYHMAPLEYLASLVGYDNIVFGTNFPGSPEAAPTLVKQLNIGEADRAKVLAGNARRIFNIS